MDLFLVFISIVCSPGSHTEISSVISLSPSSGIESTMLYQYAGPKILIAPANRTFSARLFFTECG